MSRSLSLITIALLPIILPQGIYVKKKTPRLAEAKGERVGVLGSGDTLSLLILGDSAAAGVGVENQQSALLGALLAKLSNVFCTTYWLNAQTGRTTQQLMTSVEHMLDRPVDVIVTSIGVNDVTQLYSPLKWIKLQRKLYERIQQKFQPKLIVVTAVPPMHLFPALPKPLSTLFGRYSTQMNEELSKFVATQPNMVLVDFDMALYQREGLEMAEDGFHPSEEIYKIWAGVISENIKLRLQKVKS